MKLCKLCKSSLFHSCIAQISAVFAQLCKLCKQITFHSTQKMADFCAMQLCKLCTPLKGGFGALHSTIIPLGGAGR